MLSLITHAILVNAVPTDHLIIGIQTLITLKVFSCVWAGRELVTISGYENKGRTDWSSLQDESASLVNGIFLLYCCLSH